MNGDELENYELVSSLIDNEIKSAKDLDKAINILLSDNKYRNFWNNSHIIKDSFANVDEEIENFLEGEANNNFKKSKFKNLFNNIILSLKNIIKPAIIPLGIFSVILFIGGVFYFYTPPLEKEIFSSNNNIEIKSVDYNKVFHLTNKLLNNISDYIISSNNYVLNFEKYLSKILYKFDMETESYSENQGIEDTNEIITKFFYD